MRHPMKPSPPPAPQELELKLSLPLADAQRLRQQLARVALLSRRTAAQQSLHNIYYDTPDQQLRQQRAVLRLRRVGDDLSPRWLQTFKTGASDTSALSQRGEWESPVDGAALSRPALQATPWSQIDTDGRLFAALAPCFVTAFERTLWLVRRRDGSVVEVALDLGQIEADDKTTPICELELELKAGQPAALFAIAQQIARTVAVLPATMSKAQRGFLLAQGGLNQAHRAQLPRLTHRMPVLQMVQQVLRSALAQFTQNLESLRHSDDPEVVHQARVGWRRFKSALRLFRKFLPLAAPKPSAALQALLDALGELRNMDVARTETLPALADAFTLGQTQRTQAWQAMMTVVTQATDLQRATVRRTLQTPATGASLLAIVQWLEGLSDDEQAAPGPKVLLRPWAKQRMHRLSQQLDAARQVADTPAQWHRVRILAKRLRYGSEHLQDVLPHRRVKQGVQSATAMQDDLGAARDVAQLSALVAKLDLPPYVAEFLRGVALGAGGWVKSSPRKMAPGSGLNT